MDADFEGIREAVKAAHLPADTQHTVSWSIDQLPGLYRQFCDTYESRFGEAIRRLVQGVLKALAEAGAPGLAEAGAPGLADVLLARLQALHERLGLQALGLQAYPAKRRRPRKAG